MKADHFHAPSPCFQWDHPPHVAGEHILHRQHPWVLRLPKRPRVQSTLFSTNPHAQKTPGQLLHTSGWLLTGSLTAWWRLSPPRGGWQGTDLLAVLQPASLLTHWEMTSRLRSQDLTDFPTHPDIFFEGTPRQGGGWERGRLEGHGGCLHLALQEQLRSSSNGNPLGSQQGSPGAPAVLGTVNRHHMAPGNPHVHLWLPLGRSKADSTGCHRGCTPG